MSTNHPQISGLAAQSLALLLLETPKSEVISIWLHQWRGIRSCRGCATLNISMCTSKLTQTRQQFQKQTQWTDTHDW